MSFIDSQKIYNTCINTEHIGFAMLPHHRTSDPSQGTMCKCWRAFRYPGLVFLSPELLANILVFKAAGTVWGPIYNELRTALYVTEQ